MGNCIGVPSIKPRIREFSQQRNELPEDYVQRLLFQHIAKIPVSIQHWNNPQNHNSLIREFNRAIENTKLGHILQSGDNGYLFAYHLMIALPNIIQACEVLDTGNAHPPIKGSIIDDLHKFGLVSEMPKLIKHCPELLYTITHCITQTPTYMQFNKRSIYTYDDIIKYLFNTSPENIIETQQRREFIEWWIHYINQEIRMNITNLNLDCQNDSNSNDSNNNIFHDTICRIYSLLHPLKMICEYNQNNIPKSKDQQQHITKFYINIPTYIPNLYPDVFRQLNDIISTFIFVKCGNDDVSNNQLSITIPFIIKIVHILCYCCTKWMIPYLTGIIQYINETQHSVLNGFEHIDSSSAMQESSTIIEDITPFCSSTFPELHTYPIPPEVTIWYDLINRILTLASNPILFSKRFITLQWEQQAETQCWSQLFEHISNANSKPYITPDGTVEVILRQQCEDSLSSSKPTIIDNFGIANNIILFFEIVQSLLLGFPETSKTKNGSKRLISHHNDNNFLRCSAMFISYETKCSILKQIVYLLELDKNWGYEVDITSIDAQRADQLDTPIFYLIYNIAAWAIQFNWMKFVDKCLIENRFSSLENQLTSHYYRDNNIHSYGNNNDNHTTNNINDLNIQYNNNTIQQEIFELVSTILALTRQKIPGPPHIIISAKPKCKDLLQHLIVYKFIKPSKLIWTIEYITLLDHYNNNNNNNNNNTTSPTSQQQNIDNNFSKDANQQQQQQQQQHNNSSKYINQLNNIIEQDTSHSTYQKITILQPYLARRPFRNIMDVNSTKCLQQFSSLPLQFDFDMEDIWYDETVYPQKHIDLLTLNTSIHNQPNTNHKPSPSSPLPNTLTQFVTAIPYGYPNPPHYVDYYRYIFKTVIPHFYPKVQQSDQNNTIKTTTTTQQLINPFDDIDSSPINECHDFGTLLVSTLLSSWGFIRSLPYIKLNLKLPLQKTHLYHLTLPTTTNRKKNFHNTNNKNNKKDDPKQLVNVQCMMYLFEHTSFVEQLLIIISTLLSRKTKHQQIKQHYDEMIGEYGITSPISLSQQHQQYKTNKHNLQLELFPDHINIKKQHIPIINSPYNNNNYQQTPYLLWKDLLCNSTNDAINTNTPRDLPSTSPQFINRFTKQDNNTSPNHINNTNPSNLLLNSSVTSFAPVKQQFDWSLNALSFILQANYKMFVFPPDYHKFYYMYRTFLDASYGPHYHGHHFLLESDGYYSYLMQIIQDIVHMVLSLKIRSTGTKRQDQPQVRQRRRLNREGLYPEYNNTNNDNHDIDKDYDDIDDNSTSSSMKNKNGLSHHHHLLPSISSTYNKTTQNTTTHGDEDDDDYNNNYTRDDEEDDVGTNINHRRSYNNINNNHNATYLSFNNNHHQNQNHGRNSFTVAAARGSFNHPHYLHQLTNSGSSRPSSNLRISGGNSSSYNTRTSGSNYDFSFDTLSSNMLSRDSNSGTIFDNNLQNKHNNNNDDDSSTTPTTTTTISTSNNSIIHTNNLQQKEPVTCNTKNDENDVWCNVACSSSLQRQHNMNRHDISHIADLSSIQYFFRSIIYICMYTVLNIDSAIHHKSSSTTTEQHRSSKHGNNNKDSNFNNNFASLFIATDAEQPILTQYFSHDVSDFLFKQQEQQHQHKQAQSPTASQTATTKNETSSKNKTNTNKNNTNKKNLTSSPTSSTSNPTTIHGFNLSLDLTKYRVIQWKRIAYILNRVKQILRLLKPVVEDVLLLIPHPYVEVKYNRKTNDVITVLPPNGDVIEDNKTTTKNNNISTRNHTQQPQQQQQTNVIHNDPIIVENYKCYRIMTKLSHWIASHGIQQKQHSKQQYSPHPSTTTKTAITSTTTTTAKHKTTTPITSMTKYSQYHYPYYPAQQMRVVQGQHVTAIYHIRSSIANILTMHKERLARTNNNTVGVNNEVLLLDIDATHFVYLRPNELFLKYDVNNNDTNPHYHQNVDSKKTKHIKNKDKNSNDNTNNNDNNQNINITRHPINMSINRYLEYRDDCIMIYHTIHYITSSLCELFPS